MALGLPDGSTLESYYGEALEHDVAFIRNLRALVEKREDNQRKDILQTYCMNNDALCKQRSLHCKFQVFDEFFLAECKENIVANIRPMSFRKAIESFSSRYRNPAFTFNSLVSLIVKELELELVAMNRMSKHGVGNFSNAAAVDNNLFRLSAINSSIDKAIDPVTSASPSMTCFNCQKKGHSATKCTVICKFHKKQCADKMVCFREHRSAKQKAAKELAKAK